MGATTNDEHSKKGEACELSEPLVWVPSSPKPPPTGEARKQFLNRNTHVVPQLCGITWSEFELRVWEREWKDHQETLQWHHARECKNTLHIFDEISVADKKDVANILEFVNGIFKNILAHFGKHFSKESQTELCKATTKSWMTWTIDTNTNKSSIDDPAHK